MKLPWLDPDEQKEVVSSLLEADLIKFSNARDLPLKSGGKTDIYINLRDARNRPYMIRYLAELYANPLRRLKAGRFIEVPDSVSCFAGPLSIETGIPYVTIREAPKEGRVAKAKSIGASRFGEAACIIDDVITDGASKVGPYREGSRMGFNVRTLVVLVDRQQGWARKFQEAGIPLPVWPGMTLHDVRRILVRDLGLMERCDSRREDGNPIIIALDGKPWEEILPLVDQLRTTGCIFKVNDLMFDRGIDWILPNLSVYGRVMADLKGHDIGATLKNIAKHFLKCPPWAVTVHASGGGEMIRAVVDTLRGTPTKVLAVTVLTSIDPATCEEIYSRLPPEEVKILAAIAAREGAHGLVCSPEEVKMLREMYPQMTLVTPGVRSPGADAGDQKRIGTPAGAISDGADNVVMGRQILGAADPIIEVERILTQELCRV